ncbi:hypothetical protein A2116_01365 [Candidatus Jorgensenbacteria bacterium GWA1_49_17]|uniref:Adenylate kinase n=2 Tax=Candidatus Joergenseniibacteriota TaxID=1752739 RepID=A0A1F6BMG8_9BACT|nr:MAG: hypothetical protein A2127_00825 [Candidatus Jorgensenbacteria bacterium GWC1_48_12]OGG39844.1 MAG: hypothetical protein A2116_01365 [Candidatus Jorgensenbacteria bacterium GWA1_49_17]
MKDLKFPVSKTKIEGLNRKFDLGDVGERKEYFEAKAGEEIKKIRDYLESGKTFIAYLVGIKNSGKGTYSKLFMEAIGGDKVRHLSVGDLVRDVHVRLEEGGKRREEVLEFLHKNYRGVNSVEELEKAILGRSTTNLVTSELVVTLIKFEISQYTRKAIFIDGFPRAKDQINYSLFLRELVGYRDDPDFLVFIDVPENIVDERIKYRVVCPRCKVPRNTRLLATKFVGYDEDKKEFYLMCDNPDCGKARMVAKEGDALGIEPIRERLETDKEIFRHLLDVRGIPQVYLKNSIPADKAADYVDDYEITPAYHYERGGNGEIKVIEKPWVVKDDDGIPSYSLFSAPVVVALLRQVAKVLNL